MHGDENTGFCVVVGFFFFLFFFCFFFKAKKPGLYGTVTVFVQIKKRRQ